MPKLPRKGKRAEGSIAWKRHTIVVECQEGDRRKVEAECEGPLAIHREVVDKTDWVLTAINVRQQVVRVEEREEAERIARVLLQHCRAPLSMKTPERVRDATPDWVMRWLRACTKAGRYVPHKRFQLVDEEEG